MDPVLAMVPDPEQGQARGLMLLPAARTSCAERRVLFMATVPARSPEQVSPAPVAWRAVALPTEPGGWGMLGEPLLVGLVLAQTWAGLAMLLALAAVAPLAILQIAYDSRLQGRRLLPELAGGVALAALAPSLMMAGGWPLGPSLTAGALLAAKGAASVLYVRARLRLDRAQQLEAW